MGKRESMGIFREAPDKSGGGGGANPSEVIAADQRSTPEEMGLRYAALIPETDRVTPSEAGRQQLLYIAERAAKNLDAAATYDRFANCNFLTLLELGEIKEDEFIEAIKQFADLKKLKVGDTSESAQKVRATLVKWGDKLATVFAENLPMAVRDSLVKMLFAEGEYSATDVAEAMLEEFEKNPDGDVQKIYRKTLKDVRNRMVLGDQDPNQLVKTIAGEVAENGDWDIEAGCGRTLDPTIAQALKDYIKDLWHLTKFDDKEWVIADALSRAIMPVWNAKDEIRQRAALTFLRNVYPPLMESDEARSRMAVAG